MTKNDEIYAVARLLQVGDVIRYRLRLRRPKVDRFKSAVVTSFEQVSGKVIITYRPCNRADSVQCAFGVHSFKSERFDKRSEWGWVSLERVGWQHPDPMHGHWSPKPGDRGYDVMH